MIKVVESTHIKSFEKGPIRRSLFSNGAVSLFHHFKGMNSASINLYFLAGSIYENKNQHGLAHLIEHMLFKERKKGTLLKQLEQKGAQVNAYTYKEYVCFEMECLSSRVDEFLPLFLQLFFNPIFEAKDLVTEKRVVIQEIKEDKDDHEIEGLEKIFSRHFDRALGHPIAGLIKDIRSYQVKDLNKFYCRYFTPERMVLSIVSGKKLNHLDDLFLKYMPKRMDTIKTPVRLTPSLKASKLKHFNSYLQRKMENCIVVYALDGLSLEHKYYYHLMLLDDLLFEGLTSQFFILLREKLGIIYGLDSSINSFAKTGNYVMVFNTQKKYLKKLDEEVKKLLDYFSTHPFTDEQIQAAKMRILDGVDMSFDDMQERAEFIALEELYQTHEFSAKWLKKKMSDIDSKGIMKLLKQLTKRGMTRVVIGPR